MKKRLFKIILFGILGYILFNIIISLTEVIILNYFGICKNIITTFVNNLVFNLSVYIILYLTIIIGIYLYDKHIVKKLNDRLEKMRERRKGDE